MDTYDESTRLIGDTTVEYDTKETVTLEEDEYGNFIENEPVNSSEGDGNSKKVGDEGRKPEDKKTGKVIPSIFNLANTVIGAGILTFPSTFVASGLTFGIIITFLVVVLSGLSMHVIIVCAEKDKTARSYQDVVRNYLGKFWLVLSELLFLANLVGCNICFLVIVGDSIEPVVNAIFGDDYFFCDRKFIICFMSIVLMWPLIFLREVKKLGFTSTIALFGILYTACMTLGLCIYFYATGGEVPEGVVSKSVYNLGTNYGIPKMIIAVPVIALSFSGIEMVAVPVYFELKKATVFKMDIVIFSALLLAATLYVIVGVVGFVNFGDESDPNFLNNYPGDSIWAAIARFFVGLTVTLSYPLIFYAMRLALHSFIQGFTKQKEIGTFEFVSGNVIFHIVTVVISLFATNIQDLFGIVGSFGSITFVFIYPLMLLGKLIYKSKMKTCWKIVCYILVVLGLLGSILLLILGELVSILQIVSEYVDG